MDAKENQWEPLENQREVRGVHEDQWESMKVYENLCKSMKNAWILITFVGSSMTARADLEKLWKLKGATKPNLTESMQIGGCPAGSKICEKIERDLPKSTKINKNQWKINAPYLLLPSIPPRRTHVACGAICMVWAPLAPWRYWGRLVSFFTGCPPAFLRRFRPPFVGPRRKRRSGIDWWFPLSGSLERGGQWFLGLQRARALALGHDIHYGDCMAIRLLSGWWLARAC